MQKPQLPYRSLIVLSCPLRIPRSLRFLPSHGRFSYPTNLTPLIRQNISAQKTRNSILNTTLVRFAYLISLCSLTPPLIKSSFPTTKSSQNLAAIDHSTLDSRWQISERAFNVFWTFPWTILHSSTQWRPFGDCFLLARSLGRGLAAGPWRACSLSAVTIFCLVG